MNSVSPQDLRSIQFPALAFSQGFVYALTSLDRITRCSKLTVKKGLYKNLLLVDASSKRFQIVGAKKIRTLIDFSFGWFFLGLLFGNPRWQVELIFAPGPPLQISIDEVKNLIFDSFTKEEDYWGEMIAFEEFRDRVATATSLEQILALFKKHFNQF